LTATWIDVKTNTRAVAIKPGGAVDNAQYDPVSKRIYVSVPGRQESVPIDSARDAVPSTRLRMKSISRSRTSTESPSCAS
jgi:hypothetical protein